MNKMPLVLIIDDEPQIRKLLEIALEFNGFSMESAATAREGKASAANHSPDLILLDIGLPDENGLDVLGQLRIWFDKPIIILSVRQEEESIVRALEAGANDYVTKPFRTGELMARIRSAIRHSASGIPVAKVKAGALEIDLANYTVHKNGQLLHFTATEFSLLALLAKNEGRVLTHHFLLREIWGAGHLKESQYLRVFIAQIRKKIEDDPNLPNIIHTESGIGYRFEVKGDSL